MRRDCLRFHSLLVILEKENRLINHMNIKTAVLLITCVFSFGSKLNAQVDWEKYPNTVISNDEVTMKVFLPDRKNGVYRATRFDWSGHLGSVKYKGHEYFGQWKDTHDPLAAAHGMGPVEASKGGGLGYDEAAPGRDLSD